MLYKTLKHKTLDGIFGVIAEFDYLEIGHSEIPKLQPYTATKEGLIEILRPDHKYKTIIEQLEDYDMVTVSIMIIP